MIGRTEKNFIVSERFPAPESAVRAVRAEPITDCGGRGGLREERRRATGKHQRVEASADVIRDLADDGHGGPDVAGRQDAGGNWKP